MMRQAVNGYITRSVTLLVLLLSISASAQEARVELRSTVVGNQEQPKVLYIVPWQQSQMPDLVYKPLQSLVDGVFREVNREEFLRELEYQEKIRQASKND